MPRYRLTLEYDGGGFVGWQHQAEGIAVQSVVEAALARLEGAPVVVYAAGRTDAGVHAEGQVVHADLTRAFTPETVRDAVNFHMKPHPVAALEVALAGPGFHARFDAVARHYRYRILNRRPPPALDRHRVWHVRAPLDIEAMRAAARLLVGTHDFTSFRASECQAKSPVKTLDRLAVVAAGEELWIDASARSFMHNQVRIMVGSLRLVGDGHWQPQHIAQALAARARAAAGPTAPPHGLTLTRVDYAPPDEAE